jgi:hypothetical protein
VTDPSVEGADVPDRTCSVEGCEKPRFGREWCSKHYTRWLRTGSTIRPETTEERFWAKVDRRGVDECWPWLGGKILSGYGSFKWDGRVQGAHRAAYEILVGPIPEGLYIDHLCRNPNCVNPAHLEPVTNWENVRRSPIANAAVNARKTHCIRGHEFTPENTYYRVGGGRTCQVCRRLSRRKYPPS